MLALKINDLKDFTGKLFLGEIFDHFSFVEGSFTTFITYTLDGTYAKEFFDSDSQPADRFCTWKEVRPYCFSIIRGTRTPLHFKIVFQLAPENLKRLLAQSGLSYTPEDIYGLYLNCQFDGTSLICTTGTSLRTFTLDKSVDMLWDEMIRKYFRKQQIPFEPA